MDGRGWLGWVGKVEECGIGSAESSKRVQGGVWTTEGHQWGRGREPTREAGRLALDYAPLSLARLLLVLPTVQNPFSSRPTAVDHPRASSTAPSHSVRPTSP